MSPVYYVAGRICLQHFDSICSPECDPDLCEVQPIPNCRPDQMLIVGRLGDTCCSSYFCGGCRGHPILTSAQQITLLPFPGREQQ